MKRLGRMLVMATAATVLLVGNSTLMGQDDPRRDRGGRGGGGWDPEQMRQRMAERMREQLEVKNDAEWKIIEDRLTAVTEAQRASRMGGAGMMMARRPGGEGGGGGGGFRGFGGEASPETEALQKALDAKASAEEIKTKLTQYREARKAREANLQKAREELRKVLSVKQEAVCVMMGILE
jgi:hypothetical protein